MADPVVLKTKKLFNNKLLGRRQCLIEVGVPSLFVSFHAMQPRSLALAMSFFSLLSLFFCLLPSRAAPLTFHLSCTTETSLLLPARRCRPRLPPCTRCALLLLVITLDGIPLTLLMLRPTFSGQGSPDGCGVWHEDSFWWRLHGGICSHL